MKVMFVGGLPSQIGDVVSFTRFGQVEDLDEQHVMEAARGGCVMLPADDPTAEAFTGDELKKRASFGSHDRAPADFLAKVKAARIRAADFAREMEEEFQAGLEPELKAGEEVMRG